MLELHPHRAQQLFYTAEVPERFPSLEAQVQCNPPPFLFVETNGYKSYDEIGCTLWLWLVYSFNENCPVFKNSLQWVMCCSRIEEFETELHEPLHNPQAPRAKQELLTSYK